MLFKYTLQCYQLGQRRSICYKKRSCLNINRALFSIGLFSLSFCILVCFIVHFVDTSCTIVYSLHSCWSKNKSTSPAYTSVRVHVCTFARLHVCTSVHPWTLIFLSFLHVRMLNTRGLPRSVLTSGISW
jgi:hypothetical protein